MPKSCFQYVCERGHVCVPYVRPVLKTRYYCVYHILGPHDPLEVVSQQLAVEAKIWRSKRVWTWKAYKMWWKINAKPIDGIYLILKGANKILIDVFNSLCFFWYLNGISALFDYSNILFQNKIACGNHCSFLFFATWINGSGKLEVISRTCRADWHAVIFCKIN